LSHYRLSLVLLLSNSSIVSSQSRLSLVSVFSHYLLSLDSVSFQSCIGIVSDLSRTRFGLSLSLVWVYRPNLVSVSYPCGLGLVSISFSIVSVASRSRLSFILDLGCVFFRLVLISVLSLPGPITKLKRRVPTYIISLYSDEVSFLRLKIRSSRYVVIYYSEIQNSKVLQGIR